MCPLFDIVSVPDGETVSGLKTAINIMCAGLSDANILLIINLPEYKPMNGYFKLFLAVILVFLTVFIDRPN